MVEITAIVLAGGQSSRMGQDKALLPMRGVPMLQHVCAIAQQCCSSVIVVTSWPDRYRAIAPGCEFITETWLPGATESPGPMVAFAQALDGISDETSDGKSGETSTDWILLLACDLPQLQEDVIRQGIDCLPELDAAILAFVPWDEQRWHPLCGFYRRRCVEGLKEFMSQGGRSFQRWLTQLQSQAMAQAWQPTRPEILFNCNTPDDLELLD
jgi:molybdopterin-guanine dinucleotide biosynthesis protein A